MDRRNISVAELLTAQLERPFSEQDHKIQENLKETQTMSEKIKFRRSI